MNGLRHSAATAPAGQTGAVTPTPGKPSTSDRTQSSSGTTDTSGIREDFRAWLTEETEKIVAGGGSAADVTKAVRQSIGASETSGSAASSDPQNASVNEMKLLIDSLDKSILGNVGSSLDSEEVAADLIAGGADSQRVIDRLVSGHLNSIVMTASDDLDNSEDGLESDVTKSIKDVSTETLAQNLETIMAKLGGMGS